MPTLHAVFYRNLSLGHRGSPTLQALEAALTAAGAIRVASTGSNGTVLLEAADPLTVVHGAARELERTVGYRDAAFVRPFGVVASIAGRRPFEGHSDARTYRETFTFFDGLLDAPLDLPWTNGRGDVEFLAIADGIAAGTVRWLASGPGSPNAEIERLTGSAATTRTRQTVERLVALGRAW